MESKGITRGSDTAFWDIRTGTIRNRLKEREKGFTIFNRSGERRTRYEEFDYQSRSQFEMVEKDMPKASEGRVILKTKYVAICGSDNMLWNAYQGMSIGHEFSGYVEDPGDFPFKKGARVCAAEFNPCGQCKFCKNGQDISVNR